MIIRIVIDNIRIRWNEWFDKRPLVGEQIFIEVKKL